MRVIMLNALYQEKKIDLENLVYWNVELQEAYFSSQEANVRFKSQKK